LPVGSDSDLISKRVTETDSAPNTYRGSILHRAGLQREFLTAT